MPDTFLIHVVDDDEAVRLSLRMLLEASGYTAHVYRSAEAFLAALAGKVPGPQFGCLLLDVHMPGGMDGLSLLDEIRQRGVSLPTVVITGQGDVPMAVRAMRVGAMDFLEKPYDEDQLLSLLEAAKAQSRDIQFADRRRAGADERLAMLGPREREVLRLLVRGMSNKLIAHELSISPRTVEAHRASMMARLGVGSLAEAVRIALIAKSDLSNDAEGTVKR